MVGKTEDVNPRSTCVSEELADIVLVPRDDIESYKRMMRQ